MVDCCERHPQDDAGDPDNVAAWLRGGGEPSRFTVAVSIGSLDDRGLDIARRDREELDDYFEALQAIEHTELVTGIARGVLARGGSLLVSAEPALAPLLMSLAREHFIPDGVESDRDTGHPLLLSLHSDGNVAPWLTEDYADLFRSRAAVVREQRVEHRGDNEFDAEVAQRGDLIGAIVVKPTEGSARAARVISEVRRRAMFPLRGDLVAEWNDGLNPFEFPAREFEQPSTLGDDEWGLEPLQGADVHDDGDRRPDDRRDPFDRPQVLRPVPYSFVVQRLLDQWLEEEGISNWPPRPESPRA